MKVILFLFGVLISGAAQAQSPLMFFTFDGKNLEKNIWTADESEFKLPVKTELMPSTQNRTAFVQEYYYDVDEYVGIKINTANLDYIRFIIDGGTVDPLKTGDMEYDGKTKAIFVQNVVILHLREVYRGNYPNDPVGLNKKVLDVAKGHIDIGGGMVIKVKYKDAGDKVNNETEYKLIPEKNGFVWLNLASPFNTQYSAKAFDNPLNNLINIFYPFQYVLKATDRTGVNLNSISKRISFGPFISLSYNENKIKFEGVGPMIALGASYKGNPILGIGRVFSANYEPFWVLSINPIECLRLLLNPGEILTN